MFEHFPQSFVGVAPWPSWTDAGAPTWSGGGPGLAESLRKEHGLGLNYDASERICGTKNKLTGTENRLQLPQRVGWGEMD